MTAPAQPIVADGRHTAPRRRFGRPSDRILYGLIGFLIILPIWELLPALGITKYVTLSSPSRIVTVFFKDIFSWYLPPNIWVSAQEYVVGFALAAISGIALGLTLGMFRRVRYLFEPWLDALYATPTIALVPLIILVFGIGFTQKIAVVWLEAIIVITVSVISGVAAAERKHLDTAFSFRASRRLRFTSVVLPSSVPFILTGMRLGATRALVGVVVAEFLASNAGIGFYINFAGSTLRTDRVMLGVILLGIFGIVVGEVIRRLERRFEKWRPAIR